MPFKTHLRCLPLAAGVISLLCLASAISPSFAQASASGRLKCDVEGRLSYIVGSSRRLDCVFTPTGGLPEYYQGTINKIGIDIGFQSSGVIVWEVISPGLKLGPGSLAGNYVGVSADAAAGLGVGANALIGGNKVVLQPLSVSGDVGINLAAGIGDIALTYVAGPAPVIRELIPFGQ